MGITAVRPGDHPARTGAFGPDAGVGTPEVTVRIYRVARPAGFSNDGPGRGLHNAQLAFELRHLGREHGTDRLHCLRSPVGMPLDVLWAFDLIELKGERSAARSAGCAQDNPGRRAGARGAGLRLNEHLYIMPANSGSGGIVS